MRLGVSIARENKGVKRPNKRVVKKSAKHKPLHSHPGEAWTPTDRSQPFAHAKLNSVQAIEQLTEAAATWLCGAWALVELVHGRPTYNCENESFTLRDLLKRFIQNVDTYRAVYPSQDGGGPHCGRLELSMEWH